MSTTAAKPYFEENDGQGRVLAVFARDDGKAAVKIERHENGIGGVLGSFVADPLTAPDLCRAICEAAGTVPPAMLGRPDIPEGTSGSPWRDCELTVAVDGGKVRQMWRDGPSLSMTPAQARQHAAALVVLADQADAEPDAAEVEELAREIHASGPYAGMALNPSGDERDAARTALLWMRKREAAS